MTKPSKAGTIVIASMRMMGWLCFHKHEIVDIKQDLKDPSRKVFIFRDTERVRENMRTYHQHKDMVEREDY